MPIPLFSERNIKPENVSNLPIKNAEAKRKIIENWQKGIVSGKILSQNEKKLQSEFLNKIFGEVLGYAYEKHLETWQLENELKVNLDGRTPDGALGYFSFQEGKIQQKVSAVIELKGPLTNLDKKQNRADFKGTPVEQAFSYVPKLSGECAWVIVSNCVEIRLYRYTLGMGSYERFDILELLQNGNFKRFCYILQQGQLFLDVTDSPIEKVFQSREQELKNITNEFYNRYKDLREKLFTQIRRDNTAIPSVDLLRCTQKLIDRLLFMCFVRDLDIVQNMINAVERAVAESFDQEEDALWHQLKYAFVALDKGYVKKNVPPFNGGLFRRDELLENLAVKDMRLSEFMTFLNRYNYQNELNINILGHIFEQSISDIEEIKSRLQTEEPLFEGVHESKNAPANGAGASSKRKADGVFYTPEYITRYMVEQALGSFLEEAEHQIFSDMNITELPVLTVLDYETVDMDLQGRSTQNQHITLHIQYWESYEIILRKIRVIDPACGSGAFLTQVFDYLYERWRVMKTEIHRLTTPYKKQLRDLEALQKFGNDGFSGAGFEEWNIKKNIIQNNLFGVDLNPESVEITKLSLWMKTANKKEKLADMDGNIKQGNSLIDDPAFSDSSFDWQSNFATVFANGGFDIVVGNPPYGAELDENSKAFLKHKFALSTEGKIDTYKIFFELGMNLLKKGGVLSFITPNTFLYNVQSKPLRKWLVENFTILDAVELRKNIFVDAPDVVTVIISFRNKTDMDYSFHCRVAYSNIDYKSISSDIFEIDQILPIKFCLNDKDFKINLRSNLNFAVINSKLQKLPRLGEFYKLRQGTKPYGDKDDKQEIFISNRKLNDTWEKAINGRNISRYMIEFENEYVWRNENLHSCIPVEVVSNPKIYFQRMRKISLYPRVIACYDEGVFNGLYTCSVIYGNSHLDLKYILCLLNSELINLWYKYFDTDIEIKLSSMKEIPIPNVEFERQAPFIQKAEMMLAMNKGLYENSQSFLSVVKTELKVEKINERLQNWYKMPYEGFVSEVKKQKGGFKDLSQQMEWQGFFKENQAKAVALQEKINTTNHEIDDMVFGLYDLTSEEIGIVRG